MNTQAYIDAHGISLTKLKDLDLVQLYRKVVEMESSNKVVLVKYDTHKDIQLIENEFARRFTKVENMTNKNVYTISFSGHYLGGDAVVVTSGGEKKAKNMLRKELPQQGLKAMSEIFSITKVDLTKEQVIVQDNGDY